MSSAYCLIHANCQAMPLECLLHASPDFARNWRISIHTNYTRLPMPPGLPEGCSLFLYQELDSSWGPLASAQLCQRLPATTPALCIPNMQFRGYWPFWTNKCAMNFGDAFLEHLVSMGLTASEILHLYLNRPLSPKYNLDTMLAESLHIEREKEQRTLVQTVDFVLEHWQHRPMFTTINHPAPLLLEHVANGILKALSFPPLPGNVLETLPAECLSCDPNGENGFELPIHPGVAAHHHLAFGKAEQRYPVFGRSMTFAQYATCYVDCRLKGQNFIDYLSTV